MARLHDNLTEEQYIEAITACGGIITNIAKMLKKSRQGVWVYINKHPKVKEVLYEQREILIDEAEAVVKNSITIDQNVETAKWYLRFVAPDRGYVETVKVNADVKVSQKMDLSALSVEELSQLEEILRKTTDIASS